MAAVGVSVVIPTLDREGQLAVALSAIAAAARRIDEPVEAIVADDSRPPARGRQLTWTVDGLPVRRVFTADTGGQGPAAARNAGVAVARYDLIAFTDDDARCDINWLAAGTGPLRADSRLAGVEGSVRLDLTHPVDPVRSRLVLNTGGGSFMTASMFLRRRAIDSVGGFRSLRAGDPRWEVPFREDSDLALRVIRSAGPIRFEPSAIVLHPAEVVSLERLITIGRYFIVDGAFVRLHPQAAPGVLERPFARARIRLATALVIVTPLVGVRRTRRPVVALIVLIGCSVSAHFQSELRRAGVKRGMLRATLDTVHRTPRALLWCLAAGSARLQGEAMAVLGMVDAQPGAVEPDRHHETP